MASTLSIASHNHTLPPAPDRAADREAYEALRGLAHRRAGAIPPESLAAHVLSVTEGGDWPVREAAIEAIIRRWGFARRDELVIAKRPSGRALLGLYGTRRKGASTRPYVTSLGSLDPIRASCDCADFVRSSLGVCKHVLVVLDELHKRPDAVSRAVASTTNDRERPCLAWDPVRPLTGAGDWAERVMLLDDPKKSRPRGGALARIGRYFVAAEDGKARLRDTLTERPGERLALMRELREVVVGNRRHPPLVDAEPAILRLLDTEIERLASLHDGPLAARELRRHLRGIKRKLFPYQVEGIERFFHTGRLLLGDDMGLGKTAQAIAACHVLCKSGRAKGGVVLAPASLKSQWLREWQLFCDTPATVVDGNPAERRAIYRKHGRGFLIMSYEQLLRDLDEVRRLGPEVVVLDEAQRIKNWATKTASYVKQLTPRYRLVLTGTPMENRLDELASLVEWVDPLALEPLWRLGPWHTTRVDGGKEISGARHLDTLRARLSGCMLRRLRTEVLKQLPSRTDTRVPVEMTAEQREAHDDLTRPIAQIMARAAKRPLTQSEFLRLMSLLTQQRILCNGMAQRDFDDVWPELGSVSRPSETLLRRLASPKLLELRELLRNLVVEQQRKVVVFSQWRRMLLLCDWATKDVLGEAGARAVHFTGAESQQRRTQNIVDFHDDPRVAVMFATDAGGTGLNLQRAASCCVNLDLPWNPAVLEQRIGRIHRLGQELPIGVYNLVSDQGIEGRIHDIVGAKQALFKGLFDETSDEVTFERAGSFLKRVERLVDPSLVEAVGAQTHVEVEQSIDADEQAAELPSPVEGHAAPVALEPAAAPSGTEQLAALFSRLKIEAHADGGVTIQAPPETATALAALLGGLSRQLQSAARS
ncbi:MAG: DEAD/DEAH box helicase [Myxococcota bacterium]